jgi:NAD(P)-dependent dehydrogenase (short-subunit alcohol dehydrogenase family)
MEFPTFALTDKVALVTGADKGIGQGIAVGLAHAGASVAITTRRLSRADETLRMIEAEGRPAHALELDVSQVKTMPSAVDEVVKRFGRIDILVNNAGYNFVQTPFEVTEEKWDEIYDTNVKGLFFMSQAVGKAMAAQGGGKIVNIASQAGVVAIEGRVTYCSSKAAVIHMTRVLAMEWARYKIWVNAVAPTFVKTSLTAPMLDEPEFGAHVRKMIVLDRLGTPQDVAMAVIYMASPASDLVTGQTLLVDGGWTIH